MSEYRDTATPATGTSPAEEQHITRLSRLLNPEHIAIIGASRTSTKIGGRPLKYLRDAGYSGHIYPVNPTAATVDTDFLPDLSAVPEPVDVAIVSLPKSHVVPTLEQNFDLIHNAIIFSSGFQESDPSDRDTQRLIELHARGMGILGPNSVGLYNGDRNLPLTFSRVFEEMRPVSQPRRLAMVSQSGAFAARFVNGCLRNGVGLSQFVNTGNEAGYDAASIIAGLISQSAPPSCILLYLESIRDGEALQASLALAWKMGIRVVALCGGRTYVGRSAAQTHTAAVSSDPMLLRQILDQCGVVVVDSDGQLLDAARANSMFSPLRGQRIGVVTFSGGAGVIAADLLSDAGLSLPALRGETQAVLSESIPTYGSTRNPVDMTANFVGSADSTTSAVETVVSMVAASGEVDGILAFTGSAEASVIERAADTHDMPIILGLLDATTDELRTLASQRVLAYESVGRSVSGLATLRSPQFCGNLGQAVVGTFTDRLGPNMQAGLEALEAFSIKTAPWRLARTVDGCIAASDELGTPVVLKGNAPSATHKLRSNLIRLLQSRPDQIRASAAELLRTCSTLIVQSQLSGSHELLIGVRTNTPFGVMVVLGLGGSNVETVAVTCAYPARAVEDDRLSIIGNFLRRIDLYEDDLAKNVDVAATSLVHLARHFGLAELEVNPFIVQGTSLTAVDVRTVDSS